MDDKPVTRVELQEALDATGQQLSHVDAGLSEPMSVVERRLLEIEKKLFLNPPPA